MRNLIFFLLLLTALPASSQVVAGNYTPGFYSSVNYVKNPSCILNDANITDASGIVSRTTTSPITEGLKASCLIDGTASAQVVKFTMNSFDTDLDGDTCSASITYRGDASLYKIYVESPVSTKISADVQLMDTGSTPRTERINFPCGVRANSKALVIETTGASPAAIRAGNVYGGKATNVGPTQLISETTSWSPAAVALSSGSITNQTSTGTYSRIGDRAKIKTMTVFSSASAAFSGFKMSLPPGCVIDTAKVANDPSFSVSLGYASLLDSGVSHYAISGKVALISGDNQNVAVTWATTNYAQIAISNTAPFTFAANDTISTDFEVPCVGWTAQTIVMPDAQGWFAAASITGASASLSTTTQASFTEITNGSLTLTPSSGSAPIGIACASGTTNSSGATTCASANESLGVTVSVPTSGAYRVCASASNFLEDTGAATNVNATQTFKINRTSDANSTVITSGDATAYTVLKTNSGGGSEVLGSAYPFSICSVFSLSSGSNTFRLMYSSSIAGTLATNTVDIAGGVSQSAYFRVEPINSQQQAILANSVSTSATNGAYFNSSQVGSTGTVSKETGDWVSGSCSVASAVYTCTLVAGAFSTDPACHATIFGETTNYNAVVTSASTSSVVVRTFDTGNSAAAAAFALTCSSPR